MHKSLVRNSKAKRNVLQPVRKILVPVDFSDCSENAFYHAQIMAVMFQADVIVTHVCQTPYVDEYMTAQMITIMTEETENAAKELLTSFIKKNKIREFAKEIRFETIIGYTAEGIIRYAEENCADMIVMGTLGTNSIQDKLFGTVTWNCIKHAEIPVFTIPEKSKFSTFKNILIPFEGTEKDIILIEYMLEFASYFNAVIHSMHFLLKGSVINKPLLDKMNSKFRKEIESGRLNIHFAPEKNITDGILKYVKAHDIDLISMITYNRGLVATIFHMSICRYVVSNFSFPLLAFNADKL